MAVSSYDVGVALCKVLGLSLPCRKIVIECEADEPVRVYVVAYPNENQMRDAIKVLARQREGFEAMPVADVMVTDDGEVIATPLEQQM